MLFWVIWAYLFNIHYNKSEANYTDINLTQPIREIPQIGVILTKNRRGGKSAGNRREIGAQARDRMVSNEHSALQTPPCGTSKEAYWKNDFKYVQKSYVLQSKKLRKQKYA